MANSFETFGSYIFLKKLAAGGMAEVFLARPASLGGNGRVQVVKRILPHVANNSMFLNMFQREIRIIMGFNHPHTVQLHDFGNVNAHPYIAMEYIEGKNLKDVMSKFNSQKRKIPIPMTLSLIAQAASGLSYAHTFENKVTGEVFNAVHRDITPHNLIISYDGNLKVIDFGIAKAACSINEMTQTGVLKGKAAYFAPEQISGKDLDGRTDVFALGTVAWELLTLHRLFLKPGDSELTTMDRVNKCDQNVVAPSTFNTEVPPEVDEIILKALKKNPDERFATARDFQVALRQVMLRYYPNYSYADTGQLLTSLFEKEIQEERRELRELNDKVQASLTGTNEDTTFISGSEGTNAQSAFNGGADSVTASDRVLPAMDMRLMKIESMMKQKATARHYLLFAFYVISLIALKLSDRYDVWGMFLPEDNVVAEAPAQPKTNKKKTTKAAATKPAKSAVNTSRAPAATAPAPVSKTTRNELKTPITTDESVN